jgi:hypothetical protein
VIRKKELLPKGNQEVVPNEDKKNTRQAKIYTVDILWNSSSFLFLMGQVQY